IDNKKSIYITSQTNNNKITIGKISIRNDFDNFKKIYQSEDNTNYVFQLSNNQAITLSINYDDTLLEVAQNLNNKHLTKWLKKNNITNDIELLKHLKDAKQKTNILSNLQQIKTKNALQTYTTTIASSLDNLTIIEGDITGYIYNSHNKRVVYLLKNNKRYALCFTGIDYFTDDYITELLTTITIE
ncbi:MAG: hypothetical protein K2M17_03530, partial [Bacilli bacterium]|nr:hypothetical protein [Bacilli bacterium]